MRKPLIEFRTIVATAIGGVLLLFATVFLSAFLSSPPTRAEFDSFKTEILTTNKSIDEKLTKIENKQEEIINYLLNSKRK